MYYVKNGNIPEYRHTYDNVDSIYREELFGLNAFDGPYSLIYHEYDPTEFYDYEFIKYDQYKYDDEIKHRHIKTSLIPRSGNIFSRNILFENNTLRIGIIKPEDTEPSEYFRNGFASEVFYIHNGSGRIESVFGDLDFRKHDYIYIPKGTTYKYHCSEDTYILSIESSENIDIPKRYLNRYGQIKEGSPYYTRNFRVPVFKKYDDENDYTINIRYKDGYARLKRKHKVFDAAGWDGYLYPYAINVMDMAPIVGKLHMPPPVHETFEAETFMIGTFLPRPFDFHERSIPISYFHNNIDSDEFLFYSSGNFMSRKGIEEGSVTLHVHGIIHGPQPGVLEKSIGARSTDEIGIMVETYKSLKMPENMNRFEDKNYNLSWKY
ncbi:homogentisate 1,2-dioxygenase [Picrophilus oshimae]|uniref:Homogentisate 1,2-dioxygenase n=1 Tax=Picrophilus torridus (strain ATCC 700027 / DSM 9790 / JCM 10055 / NBRC 100828 / KAW 2/3) TaxID=1122961 RepID=A0A8G2FWY6_PICTO|nr:homogentisate 1,2-dioxygenase [Picrophilus oshimae]SMD30971.1 homogentisate 1,2-dioxygenase [Picrophilus oshimae DSM 9789]